MRKELFIHFTTEELSLCQKHFPEGLIVFDLETTGLSSYQDVIIEISALKIKNGIIEVFDELVYTEKKIYNSHIHGISETLQASSQDHVLKNFLVFIEDIPSFLGHGVSFDLSFLMLALMKENLVLKEEKKVFDSARITKKRLQVEKNNLPFLVKHFELEVSSHVALHDAYACLKIYLKCLNEFSKEESYVCDIPYLVENHDQLDFLQKSLEEVLNIEYKKKKRMIQIKSLVSLPQGWAIYAECFKDRQLKYFYLKDITFYEKAF